MESIKDKVAIVGMGCTRFGELWDKSGIDLAVEAAYEAFEDAGIGPKDVQAAWLGTLYSGWTGQALAEALQLDYIPITRVENACASGSDALRNAVYAVASGSVDVALALGFEKLKDTGLSGLQVIQVPATTMTEIPATAPAMFAMLAPRYFHRYGLSDEEGKRTIGKISVKSHANGALHPKAHFQKAVDIETVMKAPIIAWPLGLYDCSGVSDGAAAAIVVRKDMAKSFRDDPVYIKAMALVAGPRQGQLRQDYDYLHFEENVRAAQMAYKEAGITDPFKQLSLAEVHDCFSITEMVIYEDLGFCPRGAAKEYIDGGAFELHGELPVQPDGGLKCFGHPIGASGLRMMYEVYKQCQGKAQRPERQIKNASLGLTHTLGGDPRGASIAVMIAGL